MKKEIVLDVVGLSIGCTEDGGEHERYRPLLLDNIGLSVAKGEIVGIVGGSGAGKSTLGRALLGYLRPGTRRVGGRISFRGAEVTSMTEKQLRHVRGGGIAYIAQNPAVSFNPSLTIGAQIIEVFRTHQGIDSSGARQALAKLLDSLQLPEPESFARRYPHQVSGGQLQRAMIAMALAGAPQLIVFDEPTTALDPHTRGAVVELIRSVIRARQMSAVYISHDLTVVARIADRIERLEHGVLLDPAQAASLMTRMAGVIDVPRKAPQDHVTPPSAPALQIKTVSAGFGAELILKSVSLTVSAGSILGVVGKSGSGKSTLARLICGLHPNYEGRVALAGRELPRAIAARSFDEARWIQLVYQSAENAINPEHSVRRVLGRVVERCQGLCGTAVEFEVVALLEMVGLDSSFLPRKVRQMSGGQIQRIGIARALAAKPQVIVLDEVTSALDVNTAQAILELLRSLQRREGLTLLFISHDLHAVGTLCDEVAVVSEGEIVEFGPAASVLYAPEHVRTRELFATVAAVA